MLSHYINHASNYCCLSCARAAGKYDNAMKQGCNHGISLLLCECYRMLFLPFADKCCRVVNVNWFCLMLEHAEKICGFYLCMIQLRRVNQTLSHLIHGIDAMHFHLASEYIHDVNMLNTKALGGMLNQQSFRNAAMPIGCNLCQFKKDACCNPFR